MPEMPASCIAPNREHDFMGEEMLYFSLQPLQKIRMALHGEAR